MIKESQNYVVIEGILSEIDLDNITFKKDGGDAEAISGSIKVKVIQEIDGQNVEMEIPVHMFAGKYTNAGKENPSYASVKQVMDTFKSIAAVGADGADYVRVTGGKVAMNEYYAADGRFISFPRISASFVSRIKAEDCKGRATWEMEGYIAKMGYRTDKEGIDTETFEIKVVNIGYGGRADLIPVITNNAKIISAFSSTFQEGDTIPMSGKLNFSSTTTTTFEEVEIGDPIEKSRTVNVSDVIVTGAKGAKDDGYEVEEIQEALKGRTARLEKSKEKNKTAPAATSTAKIDLGF